MRTLLPKKEKYYKEFADVVNKTYRQMRYGISSCKPSVSEDLAFMRKHIVDWQELEDEDYTAIKMKIMLDNKDEILGYLE